jgi:zinc protease
MKSFNRMRQLLALIVLLGSTASVAVSQKPATNSVQDLQSVVAKQAALVTEFEVNGLKVLFKRREGSLTFAAGLFIKGGARNITAQNAGIESLMLTAATEASANFPRDRMRAERARLGIQMGSSSNNDYSVLSIGATRMSFDRAWQIFTDVSLRPTFAKEDVSLLQARIVSSLRDDTDDPDTYLQRLQERAAYAGHPYLNRTQGTAETISQLTPEDLRAYHRKVMQTSQLLLVIVGDLDVNQLKTLVTSAFGKLPRGTYASTPVPQLAFDRSSVEITQSDSSELRTNYIQGYFTAPPLTSRDIYPLRVASAILRDRIFEEVRSRQNLSYAPSAFLLSQGANVGGLYVTAVDANRTIRAMLEEVYKLQREQVANEDIQAVVNQFLTNYYLGQETNAAQAGELAEYELIGGGWRNSVEVIERVKMVTPAEVQAAAQKYMRNFRFVVLSRDPQSIDRRVFTGSGE